jgi:uncharacterized protein involved in copper resistance
MRLALHTLFALLAGLLLVAGLGASPAEATARPTAGPSHGHGAETSMPGMDHDASPMPSMPGMDHDASPMPSMPGMDHHDDGVESRPRALVLAGFGGLNGAVLLSALMLRRRTRPRHR